jgi:hypothetical protein
MNTFISNNQSKIKTYFPVLLLAIVMSVIGAWYFADQGVSTAYNDARSHLNLARLVFDNQKPGLAQLGGVWLPLQHWLMLPFVWSESLWQNGMAGVIVSMFGYIAASVGIYALSFLISNNKGVAWLASLVFLVNANAWYMQSAPMSELLLLMFFVLVAYCLAKWAQARELGWLIATALALVGATLTRYDGWFLLAWSSVVVVAMLAYWIKEKKVKSSQAEAWVLAFLTLAGSGVLFWLGWNLAIYGDPLYFMTGPYSAQAQQEVIALSGNLHTVNDLKMSLKAYSWATLNNVGFVGVFLLLVGIILWPEKWPKDKWAVLLPVTVLFSPFFFHVLSLFRGQSVLMTPELGIVNPEDPSSAWFNVRYGLIMLPAAAIWGTYFLRRRSLQILVALLLVGQAWYSLSSSDVITLTDATSGSSSLKVSHEASWLSERVQEDDLVMASLAFHNAFAYETGMPMKQFIHEGANELWDEMLIDPASNVEWIVMMNGDVGDPLYSTFIKKELANFNKNYEIAHRGSFLNIYRRSNFVRSDGTQLIYKGQPLHFVGANSYDLLYQSPDHMRQTLQKGKRYGLNVYRFWAFGEGFAGAIQPEVGIIDESVALRLDVLLTIAKEENIKLMPVLGNYWNNYGGVSHYLGWLGLPGATLADQDAFFTNPKAKQLYWNYVEKIVNRVNEVNGIPYKDDETILAWELMNEPRSALRENQAIVNKWHEELATYVHSLDSNHLVLGGIEAFVEDLYSDVSGPYMTSGNNVNNIPIASGHLYPKYLKDQTSKLELRHVIKAWTNNSRNLNKPLIIGEVGFPRTQDGDREDWFRETLEEAKEGGVSGVFLWNFAMHVGDDYAISPEVEQDRNMLESLKELIPSVTF